MRLSEYITVDPLCAVFTLRTLQKHPHQDFTFFIHTQCSSLHSIIHHGRSQFPFLSFFLEFIIPIEICLISSFCGQKKLDIEESPSSEWQILRDCYTINGRNALAVYDMKITISQSAEICRGLKNVKDRIPQRTLIFMSYDNQGISIIDPITGSCYLACKGL